MANAGNATLWKTMIHSETGDTDKWGDIDIAIRFLDTTKSICSFAISIRLLSSRFDFSVN